MVALMQEVLLPNEPPADLEVKESKKAKDPALMIFYYIGWMPLFCGYLFRLLLYGYFFRLDAIASRLEAVTIRLEASH